MAAVNVAIGIGDELLRRIDALIDKKIFPSRSKAIQEAVREELPGKSQDLAKAHLLLREHGKTLCKNNGPLCGECPVVAMCAFGSRTS